MNGLCRRLATLVLLLITCCPGSRLLAATVTNCDEGSLRAALAGGGTVTFACDGVIALSSNIFVAVDTLLDAGARNVTLSGSNATRLFVINPGVTLTLANLKLADGRALGTNGNNNQPGGPGEGGAIYNNGGALVASSCLFLRNKALGGNGGGTTGVGFPPPVGAGGAARGGAILNLGGQLLITNCMFRGNWAVGGIAGIGPTVNNGGDSSGGAIFSTNGVLVFDTCTVSSNLSMSGQGRRFGGLGVSGVASGGAIEISGGSATLPASIVAENVSLTEYINNARGGAITQTGGELYVLDSYFRGNRVTAGLGLGISTPLGVNGGHAFGGCVFVSGGILAFTNSTSAENIAQGGDQPFGNTPGSGLGGAVYSSGNLAVLNCTVAGNTALGGKGRGGIGPAGSGYGGAFHNSGGALSIIHATIADNSARATGISGSEQGGGILSAGGLVTLVNTIVANSPAGSNCFGTIIDGGHNLSSDASCHFTAPGSMNNTDPVLGPLADYGGRTPTMALLAGSPAIDAADPGSCPATDQRGVVRPFGAGCDIGAFESAPPYTALGHISGFVPPAGITISAGGPSAMTDGEGQYALHGLSAGPYIVTPASPLCVFVQSNRVVNVGPDIVGVDFYSYRSNALVLGRVSSQIVHGIFAGEAGATYRLLSSPDLLNWSPWSTNTAESSGLFDFYDTNILARPLRFFEAVRP